MTYRPNQADAKTDQLRAALSQLGVRLDAGDASELFVEVLPARLVCAHRPLRHHPTYGREKKGRNLPPEATAQVLAWVARVKEYGIRSIICLLHPKELGHYARLSLGARDLVNLYEREGFEVAHIPWDDPAHRPSLSKVSYHDELVRVRAEALVAFDRLPKPVLLHCSAGIDRSSPVAAYLFQMRNSDRDA